VIEVSFAAPVISMAPKLLPVAIIPRPEVASSCISKPVLLLSEIAAAELVKVSTVKFPPEETINF